MVMTDERCEKLFDTIVEMNTNMAGVKSDMDWLKRNAEIQVGWCQRNEDRISALEKWSSRSKGYFRIIGRALSVISAGVVAALVLLYQIMRG